MDYKMLFQQPFEFLDAVEAAARAGASALMPHWRTLDASQVSEKALNDLVSAADYDSEQAILGEINRRFPTHNVLSEEAGWSGHTGDAPTWIIDPLDGTANFVHGVPQFAISAAVAVEDRVEFGVILDPLKDEVFRAARGHGVWWNGKPCRVSPRPGLAGAMLATGFPFRARHLLESYLAIFHDVFLRCKAIRRPGPGAAALDLAYTACGVFDGFFEFQLSPWDVAAGGLMVEEAGGVVSDMDGGEEYMSSGNILCGPRPIHRELLEIVQSHREGWAEHEG
jgi:myo-inositol-1(or 4)-monophosphatase